MLQPLLSVLYYLIVRGKCMTKLFLFIYSGNVMNDLHSILISFQIYIICSVLLYAFPEFIDGYTKDVKILLLPYILPIIHIALIGSIYSTVALAVERYITICHPFMRYR